MEGVLGQPCPKGEDNLGWVQLQQKSILCQDMIEDFSVIVHEGLTHQFICGEKKKLTLIIIIVSSETYRMRDSSDTRQYRFINFIGQLNPPKPETST